MPKQKFNTIPFSPSRFPFFYGWVVLAFGTIGIIMSAPGQTSGIATFTDYLIDVFGISRDQLSTTYLIGTVSSSFLLTHAGKLYDKIGARWMGMLTAVVLGFVLFYLSQSDRIALFLGKLLNLQAAQFYVGATVLSVGFFILRLSGQGALTMLSRNMIMKWFISKRGLTGGISSVFVSLGFSVAPLVFDLLIEKFGWRGAWISIGLVAALFFSLVVFIFYRDNPEDCGLNPDGEANREPTQSPILQKAQRQYRLKEARKTYVFWIFSISMAVHALMMTGFIFNIVSIFDQVQMDKADALFIFIPASMIAVVFTLVGGYLSDYIKLKYLLILLLIGQSISAFSLPFLNITMFYYLLIAGNGIASGMYAILIGVAWPRFFGRQYLGEISGFSLTLIVFFSAIGPLLFSLSLSQFGTYAIASWICLIICLLCLVGAFRADNPQEKIAATNT
ncbi:nitrate/nitrite transporter [Mangrovibacterium sp.]|uniref:MFS transporter n=1 Tax=Mangrovibacterium sp. TaxID=1961364 RepID=UPI003569FFC3